MRDQGMKVRDNQIKEALEVRYKDKQEEKKREKMR